MWSLFRRSPAQPSPSIADQVLAQEEAKHPKPMVHKKDTVSADVISVLGNGLDAILNEVYTHLDSSAARKDLDLLIQKLPYQIQPDLYSQLATEPHPTFQPLYTVLSSLPPSEATSNFHYLYQHFLELLEKQVEKETIRTLLQKVYEDDKARLKQELLISFLDILPAGYLDQERVTLMGRDELLKTLDQLRLEKDKVEEAQIRDDALLASIGDGVVAVSSDHKVLFSNLPAREMLGVDEKTLAEGDWFELVKLVDDKGNLVPNESRPMFLALKTQQRVATNSLSFLRPDKSILAASMTATPFIIRGQPVGAVITFKDTTREREIDRQKTEFISVASHQLRTPLGSMKWNLEMLSKGYYGEVSDEAKKILVDALDTNERAIKLVNSLLDISRIEQGRVPNHPVDADVRQIIEETLKEVQPLAEAKDQTLRFETTETPTVHLDAGRLREVVENIISNAIKYTPKSGKVEVALKTDDETFTIEVADNGMGIPVQEQFKVFSRFFRAENAINQEPNGSGFGLFVVKSYVEAWGGKVWFKSPTQPDGTGTTFYLQVPLKPHELISMAPAEEKPLAEAPAAPKPPSTTPEGIQPDHA